MTCSVEPSVPGLNPNTKPAADCESLTPPSGSSAVVGRLNKLYGSNPSVISSSASPNAGLV